MLSWKVVLAGLEEEEALLLTGLEGDGEAEIDVLERQVLLLVGEEDVLGLEVVVDDSMAVVELHDLDDSAGDIGSGTLRALPPRDDAIEELAVLVELHDDVHGALVLARIPHKNLSSVSSSMSMREM